MKRKYAGMKVHETKVMVQPLSNDGGKTCIGAGCDLPGRRIEIVVRDDGSMLLFWGSHNGAAQLKTQVLLSKEAAEATAVLLCKVVTETMEKPRA